MKTEINSGEQVKGALLAVATEAGNGIYTSGTGTESDPLIIAAQLDTGAGNLLSFVNGKLRADAPSSGGSSLPGFQIELGHSAQPNGGRGIDMGSWYQLDMTIGNAFNGLDVTFNDDRTFNVPDGGLFLIVGAARIIAQTYDTYQMPPQVEMIGGYTGYGFPGAYQYTTQFQPTPATSTLATSGALGTINLSGVPIAAGNHLAVGFSKVVGSTQNSPLSMQGFIDFLKIG